MTTLGLDGMAVIWGLMGRLSMITGDGYGALNGGR